MDPTPNTQAFFSMKCSKAVATLFALDIISSRCFDSLAELVSFTATDDWVLTFIVDFCFHGSKIMASHDFTGVEVVVEGAGSKEIVVEGHGPNLIVGISIRSLHHSNDLFIVTRSIEIRK